MTIGYGDLAQQRFNVLGMLDYQDTKHVLAKDRDFGSSGIIPQYGVSRTSGNAFPANIASADFSQIFRNPAWNKCDPANGSLWLGSATSCREDYTHYIDLQPSQKHTSALARGVFQVAENHQLQAEFSYSKVETTGASAPAPSITTGKDPYYYPAGGKYYPSQLLNKKGQVVNYTGDLALSWRIFPGGRRTEVDSVQESRALLGGNGTLFDRVDYKWAYTHAESKGDVSYTDGWLSDAALRTALATGNVNPFGPQDSTGQALIDAAKIHGTIRSSVYKADTIDASGSSEIAELPAGPVMLGAGVEHHKDKYSDGYLGVVSTGDVVGGSGPQQPVAGERTVNAVFAELNVPIFKNVESQLALRRDHYSDFGSSTNPKIGLRWQPMKELLFRASAGKGFRAPTLDNLYAPQSLTNLGGNFNDPFYDSIVGCANSANPNYCNTQLTARQGGNAKLKAEKSNQWSIGVVFEPSANFSAGLDYFRINLTDAISFVSGDFIIQDWYAHQTGPTTSTSRYAGNMVRDPNTGYLNYIQAGFENAGSIQVGGFDFNMKGRIRTSFGTISPSLEGTYFTRSRQLSVGATEYANQIGIYAQSGPTIRLKTNTGVTWSKGPWEAGGNYVWQDGYLDYSGSRDVASYGLTNLQSSYSGIKNLKVTFGVNNAFNVKPPFSDQGDYFQVGFDPTYADVRLRTWYLRGSYKFW
jgi:iron complex outermembrane receptor protein